MLVFIIGFMGSGKTHTGKKLAQLLNYHFIDLDKSIQKKSGKSIPEIFDQDGETQFRIIERNTLHQVIQQTKRDTIISCGGGVPCFFDNIQQMNQNGITVFLHATPNILCQRLLLGRNHRPLLKGKTPEQLLQFIDEKLSERMSYYSQAMVTVRQNKDHFDAAESIYHNFYQIIGH